MTEFELKELSRELNSQDNRCTAEPLYCVQEEERIWGMDGAYADDYEWYDPEMVETYTDDEAQSLLIESGEWDGEGEFDAELYGWRKVFYTKRWKFVSAHLTERAATLYVEQNRHNLKNPRVYVTSQYRCHEWISVMEHLRNL